MNYSEMTDFEINKAVGEIVLEGKWACKPGCAGNQSDSWHYGSVDTFVTPYPPLPDYCNSWSDAGPIIEKHLICLVADVFAEPQDGGKWVAQPAYGWDSERVRSDNPLRATMILFLQTREKANA